MIFFKPSPEDPFSNTAWFEYVASGPIVLIPLSMLLVAITREDHTLNISMEFCLIVVLVSTMWGAYNFYRCQTKHYELLEKYGEDYKKILKRDLNRSSIRMYFFRAWENFDEELNNNIDR